MTKQQLQDSTGVVVRLGAIAAAVLGLGVFFHNRLAAVEIKQAEQARDVQYILEAVKDMKSTLERKLP